jgi:hypothetical protein
MKVFKSLLFVLLLVNMGLYAQQKYNDFICVGPAPLDYKVFDGRLFSEIFTDEANNAIVINLLPNELSHKNIVKITSKDEVSYSAIELSEAKTRYIVKTDYIKYTTLPVKKDSETGEIIGVARVGVGMRIEATLYTSKKGITVTDLYALGVNAGVKGALKGHITCSVMGIEAEEVTAGFPVNAEVSPTSIAATLQSLTMVKQAIYDNDSHLTPQVLEIKYTSDYQSGAANIMDLSMPILLPNRGEPCVVIR